MDELATRLKETSDACMKFYTEWSQDKKGSPARESLGEAVHELRKVAARLEIELAVSERDENGKPMPIPGHRSHSNKPQGNHQGNNNGGRRKPLRKSPATPKSPEGGSDDSSGNELPSFISGDKAAKDVAKPTKKPSSGTLKVKTAE